ncbi:PHP domain-containing protein, partial [Candidatus Parcubacteria bacterium]|nr:PHP domain-containing protein [Candidatus Parcubacteria bacterium]
MAAKFTHLHVHSHYSLLKALPKIPALVKRAKEVGCDSLALTDIHNLYGAIEFYKECKAADIKPIIGVDVRVENNKKLLLYAKNFDGYQNLIKLITDSYLDFPDEPTITDAALKKHSEGVLVVNPKTKDIALREIFYLDGDDRRAWETMRAIENSGVNDTGDIDE